MTLPEPLLAYLERLPDAVAVFDQEGAVVWRNHHAADLALLTPGPDGVVTVGSVSISRVTMDGLTVVTARDVEWLGRDPLTGLRDRRVLLEHVEQAVAAATRGRGALVLYIDLNGMKAVNDRDGHAAGDRRLIEFAHELVRVVRSEDVVARVGGDEFAVLMRGVDAMAARAVADAVRQRLRGLASVGAAVIDGSAEPEAVIDAADRDGYADKRATRGTAGSSQ